MVPQCELVADIGTDHGYLPIYLTSKGICKRAIAADINEGPLNAAKKNIALTRVKDNIEAVLSDGLEKIEKADCVTICGMGGELICEILACRKDGMEHFVLQPQRSVDVLRRYLAKEGFEIKKEAVSREGDKMYCAFYAHFTGESYTITDKEALLGKKECVTDKELYNEYIAYRKKEIEKALCSMEKARATGERYEELKKLLEMFV